MGKQVGPVKLEGTVGNVTFYKMGDGHYVRMKSSLSGKRVKKDPRFRRTMEYAGWLKQASGLASSCYRALPEEERVHAMYREMVGMAMEMLKAGKDAEVIAVCLEMMFRPEAVVPAVEVVMEEELAVKEITMVEIVMTGLPPAIVPQIPLVITVMEPVTTVIPMAAAMEASRLYVDNTGRLALNTFGNNLITLPPCYFQLILPEIPETHEKIRGIYPVFFHTDIRRRKFFHGAEYH